MSDPRKDVFKEFIESVKLQNCRRELIKKFPFYEPEKDGIKDYRGNCPKGHPSQSGVPFVVNNDLMFCHSCGSHWDQVSFVQEFMTNGDFTEALFLLARWGGIPLPEKFNFEEYALKRAKLMKLLELNDKYTELCLEEMTDTHYNYCEGKWGMSKHFAKERKLGFSTSSITQKMLTDGYTEEELLSSGFFIKTFQGLQPFFLGRITIPYIVNGSTVYGIGRKTEETPDNKYEKAKYKKLPCHSEKKPHLNPAIKNSYLYGHDDLLKCSGFTEVIITEGIADCIILLQSGFVSISPVTIRFRKQDIENIRIILGKPTNYTLYISLDNDPTFAGQKASLDMADALTLAGYDVRIIQIPLDPSRKLWRDVYNDSRSDESKEKSKRDTADFIKEEGRQAFQSLIDKASKHLHFLIDEVSDVNSMEFSSVVEDIAGLSINLPKGIRDELIAYIKATGTKSSIPTIKKYFQEAEKKSQITKDLLEGDISAESAAIEVVNRYISKTKYDPCGDDLYTFEKYHYKNTPFELLKKKIELEIEDCSSEFQAYQMREKNRVIGDSSCYLKRKSTQDPSFFEGSHNLLAFKNCVVDLTSLETKAHSPELAVFNAVGYEYDPQSKCPLWIKTVKKVLGDQDKVDLFHFYCGYVFSGHYNYHKSLILLGDGANGKSTLLDILHFVFGHFNVSNLRLDQLGDKFLLIKLRGMLANIASESCERSAIDSHVFKEIVSGGMIMAGDKFKSNIAFRNSAKFFQAMNNFPIITKKTTGILRRLEFLSCDEDFSKVANPDYDIGSKLLAEAPGIFNWCLEGLNRLNEEGGFITPKSSGVMLAKFTNETCSATNFLNEEFSEDYGDVVSFSFTYGEDSVPKSTIYRSYSFFCKDNGFKPMSSIPFWKVFWKKYSNLEEMRCRKRGRCIKGLKHNVTEVYQVPNNFIS